jgi:hypothetical protein
MHHKFSQDPVGLVPTFFSTAPAGREFDGKINPKRYKIVFFYHQKIDSAVQARIEQSPRLLWPSKPQRPPKEEPEGGYFGYASFTNGLSSRWDICKHFNTIHAFLLWM